MESTIHQGKLIQQVIKQSNYPVKLLIEKLDISRGKLYQFYKSEENIDEDFILQLGELLDYDFSKHFPRLQEKIQLNKEAKQFYDFKQFTPKETLAIHESYISLLKRHQVLLALLIQLRYINDLDTIQLKIEQFFQEHTY